MSQHDKTGRDDDHIEVTAQEARAGYRGLGMRYVLGIGAVLAVIALLIAYWIVI